MLIFVYLAFLKRSAMTARSVGKVIVEVLHSGSDVNKFSLMNDKNSKRLVDKGR